MIDVFQPYEQLLQNRIPSTDLIELAGPIVSTVFPTGTPKLDARLRLDTIPKKEDWAARIVFNTLFTLGFGDTRFTELLARTGVESHEVMDAFDQNYRGFLLFTGYPTQVHDLSNYVMVALTVLKDTLYIEQVQSRRSDQAGGWGLVSAMFTHLVPWCRKHHIGFIRTTATNDHSLALFIRNAMSEVSPDFAQNTGRFQRHLVLEIN